MCPIDNIAEEEMDDLTKDRRTRDVIIINRLDKLERGYTGLTAEMMVVKDAVSENTVLTRDIKEFLTGIRTTKKVSGAVVKFAYHCLTTIGAAALALAAIWVLISAIETGQVPGTLTARESLDRHK